MSRWTLPQTLLVTVLCCLAVSWLGIYVVQLHPGVVLLDALIVGSAVGAWAALERHD